jgi:TRAP-type uncharacterized transport system substrate-binding protein
MRRFIAMRTGGGAALAALSFAVVAPGPVAAQISADRANRGLVEVVTSDADGGALLLVQDLAAVLDDGATRRILPVVGKGSVQTIVDLRALRGTDAAIIQTDVIKMARERDRIIGPEASVTYVARLYDEELHILARPEIGRLEDLAGKKVNLGGGAAVTAVAVFDALKIKINPVGEDIAAALADLRSGRIAAAAYVAAKPTPLFCGIPAESGLHFLAVPMRAELAAAYAPGRLTADDYPGLVRAEAPVDTIAVGTVLMVAGLQPSTDRYRNVSAFVDAFFTQFDRLQEAPRSAKWREVNIAADFPGWRRFPAADAWLKRNSTAAPAVAPSAPAVAQQLDETQMQAMFSKFLDQRMRLFGGQPLSQQEKDQLFDQFRRWQNAQAR